MPVIYLGIKVHLEAVALRALALGRFRQQMPSRSGGGSTCSFVFDSGIIATRPQQQGSPLVGGRVSRDR